jgi:hypothetical protein
MKITSLKTKVQTTSAILALIILAPSSVFAQDHDSKHALEGAWNLQVTRLNCQTGAVIGTAPAMLTFMRGGTMIDVGTQLSPAIRAGGQGVWHYEYEGHYTAAFQFFRFNPDGTLAGRQIVRQQIALSPSGNEHTNVATAQVLDVNGNIIATNCSTAMAGRFE